VLYRFDVSRDVLTLHGTEIAERANSYFGDLRELAQRSQETFVLSDAVEILSRREHSQVELRRKLMRKGYHEAACDFALSRLAERSWQSDERFAESFVRAQMMRGGISQTRLRLKLRERGVAREIIEDAIAAWEADHPATFDAALLHAAEKLQRSGRLSNEQITQRLLRRGFPISAIKKLLA
jgi:regulatory protein